MKPFLAEPLPVQQEYVQGSLFEEDYLVRTLGAIANYPTVALTELVANAWDAGATKVSITIPNKIGKKIVIEDNGTGLTKEQFQTRWMTLGYNRVKHQGRSVIFPENVEGNRFAYGKNGVGRHGLLCFNKEYTVITNAEGTKSTFIISTKDQSQPFVITSNFFSPAKGHGTKLEVVVNKNLPEASEILKIISAKFLHDPRFVVSINSKTVPLERLKGLLDTHEIQLDGVKLKAHFIDSFKSGRSTLYQGIAFWQGGRLVGEPSWILGSEYILDGRTKFAKRYTVVVKTDDLSNYILEDWSGFKKDEFMNEVYKTVGEYVTRRFGEISKENLDETKALLIEDYGKEYTELSALAKFEIDEAIQRITTTHPTARPEAISLAIETIINLEKTRSGKDLLIKLASLSEEDISGLNELLEKWTVRDALTVLDEIDNRISVIDAIRKLSNADDVDELHVLHPLVTSARWLFGPEFESAEYASNRQLHSAIEQVFNKKIDKTLFNNHKKRPDIVIVADSTLSITGTERFDLHSSLTTVDKILIIELKRGGSKISRTERNQAQGYVEDFMGCGNLTGNPSIECYVIGKDLSEKMEGVIKVGEGERGRIHTCTFSQIVDTAEKRLFGLREKLKERYEDIPGMNLFNRPHVKQLSLHGK